METNQTVRVFLWDGIIVGESPIFGGSDPVGDGILIKYEWDSAQGFINHRKADFLRIIT